MPKNKKSPRKKNSPNRRKNNKGKGKSGQSKQSGASANGSSNGSPQQSTASTSGTASNNTSPPTELTPAMALKERGNVEFQNQRFKQAISLYSEAIELEPTNHTLFSNRSAAYKSSGLLDAALSDAEQCIALQPDWPKGYVRKGSVYIEQKKLELAEAVYKEGLAQCTEKAALRRALDALTTLTMGSLARSDKVVGGHHAQADIFRAFFSWLSQGGAKFPKFYLKFYSPEYRAIHALTRIEKDEDILFIPHDCIMTSDVAKASVMGQAIQSSAVELRSKHSYLASYLLQEREKGARSKWHYYIVTLPRKFETIPLFFDESQRADLAGSISIKKIDDRLESLRLEYESLCTAVPEFVRFSLQDFIWARLVVITRIFGLVIDDVKTDGLVPMADMLNHKRPRETKWTYSQKKRGFLVTSLQTINENCEIFDSYGRKCNSRFFVNYGFSLERNPDNEALMTLELPRNDVQFAIKARHLNLDKAHGHRKDFQVPRQYKEKKVKECFSFLRVLHAQGNEFLIISSADGLRLEDIPPLSIRNETNVLTSLAVSATKSLKKFGTSLEEDNALLADEDAYPMFTNPRNAVLMRRGEKEVLRFYVNLMRECCLLFKMKPKELKMKLRKEKKFKDVDSPLMQYVNHVVIPLVQRQAH